MEALLPERRTGARWVAGTGAFLLAAAAAVFVAVRWDEIPDGAKFGILLAFTGGCLVAGRRLRSSLPATGDALFHLGAVLLPMDLAALNLRLQLGWRGLLLAEGLLVTAVLGGLGLATGSVLLRRAGLVGGVGLAAGVAAVSPLPAPLVLAAFAVAALLLRQEEPAVAWAGVAGLAPLLAGLGAPGTLAELGLTGGAVSPAATALVTAAVLGRLAHRHQRLDLVAWAAAGLVVGGVDAWLRLDTGRDADLVALAGAFVLVELVALALRPDPFWSGPARAAVVVAEVLAGLATAWSVLLVAAAPLLTLFEGQDPAPTAAFAAAVLGTGWGVAAVRRRTFPLLAVGVVAALVVELATGRAFPTGAAMAVVAVAWLVTADHLPVARWPLALAATAFGGWGAFTAVSETSGGTVVAGLTALALAVGGARIDSRVVPVGALAALAVAIEPQHLAVGTELALFVAGAWALAVLVDVVGSRSAADTTRWLMLAVLVALPPLTAATAVPALLVLVAALVIEAVRVDDPRFAHAAAGVGQGAVLAVTSAAGLDDGQPGVALCVGAVVWAGLAGVVDDGRWRPPLLVATALGTAAGLVAAAGDHEALATAALVTGALGLAIAAVARSGDLGHAGGVVLTAGIAGHLALAGVDTSEPYLAPVAAHLLVSGLLGRTGSSWARLTPPVLLLAGAAVVERIAGGSGWHALLAGVVGVAAVVGGSWGRYAGPLVTGTGLLVVLTGYESLGVAAGVPTWAWLAIGGSVLLVTGVLLERNDTSPVEAGRRLVDLIEERYR